MKNQKCVMSQKQMWTFYLRELLGSGKGFSEAVRPGCSPQRAETLSFLFKSGAHPGPRSVYLGQSLTVAAAEACQPGAAVLAKGGAKVQPLL